MYFRKTYYKYISSEKMVLTLHVAWYSTMNVMRQLFRPNTRISDVLTGLFIVFCGVVL